MEIQEQLPGFEISDAFCKATEKVIAISWQLKEIDELVHSGKLDASEIKSLGQLWDNLVVHSTAP